MSDYGIDVTLHNIQIDGHLDRLVRSNDPNLRRMFEEELRHRTGGTGQRFQFALTEPALRQYVNTYAEQYVSDPSIDLDRYFDIVNRRFFSRNIPTQLTVLYLFGTGKQYRASVTAVSSAGEGVAGYCMEQFGYRPLVRPLGVMPDAVLWSRRNGRFCLALTESKASTTQDPMRLLDQNTFQFFVDVKTRATGFTYDYEGYLICSHLQDGRRIKSVILRVDLGYYNKGRSPAVALDPSTVVSGTVPSYENPDARLRSLIRIQADTGAAQDEYLTSILSEEASRSATLALMKKGRPPEQADEVENYVSEAAQELGLEEKWELGQRLVKDTKKAEEDRVRTAIQRYSKPDTNLEQ